MDVTLIVPPPRDARRPTPGAIRSHRRTSGSGTCRTVTFPLANRRGTTVLDRSTAYLLYGLRAGRLAAALARAGEVDIVHGFGASVLGLRGRPRGAGAARR